ncbi:hypothetical protein [Deinococcus marmoris]|nr:hypothetical protein [Deinococcus marmoris]
MAKIEIYRWRGQAGLAQRDELEVRVDGHPIPLLRGYVLEEQYGSFSTIKLTVLASDVTMIDGPPPPLETHEPPGD